ncbi:MAG TPA: UDP-N-acetylmuramoyl-L-alanine--D-glutamate ligase [Candidatus Gracilibacteria bacterium]|nr:UDP-N-acetylmuramoyl-L-alanine--D-glutamate ligase [Candidatus Gracilibacteria bacterium]
MSKIAILGYGVEGQSTARYFGEKAEIDIIDDKKSDAKAWPQSWAEYDLVFRSPGIHPFRPELPQGLSRTKLTSQMEYFLEKCPAPIIGVTGTKGKGTTSSLIQKMLENDGRKCFLGGNIGLAPLDFLDEVKEEDWVVLEVSSFQAFDLKKSPKYAVILMVTSEHLDYHHDQEEYVQAKAGLVKNQNSQDFCIYHQDFPNSKLIADFSPGQKIPFSPLNPNLISAYLKDNALYYQDQFLLHTKEFALIGEHNYNNILASASLAKQLGVSNAAIIKTLQNFSGLPLRLEKMGEKEGIIYINDSFSTTPETAIAAIKAFPRQNVAVLLGGSNKNSDYTELGEVIAKSPLVQAYCFGEMAQAIAEKIQLAGGENFQILPHLSEAFVEAQKYLTDKFGVLLLSPACASFDEFTNYKERGKYFQNLSESACS